MICTFLTFADSRLSRSLARLRSEAEQLGVFDQIYALDEAALDEPFKRKYQNFLRADVRGYGYWCWKPQVIKQTLDRLSFGDILLYTDVGCEFNQLGIDRLRDYFQIVSQSKTGILAFQAVPPELPLVYDGRALPDLTERLWTKGDVFDYFSVRSNEEIVNTPSYGAGIIVLQKSLISMNFIDLWIKAIDYSFNLLDDSPSVSKNLDGFIEHRHDQSIFSIMCKLHNVERLSAYEYWYPVNGAQGADWDALSQMPIHAKRNLDFGPFANLCRFMRNKTNGLRKRLNLE